MALEESDPRTAARRYAVIAARTRGDTASYALYSQAYVEYFRLRRRAAALETLDLFRRRFPRSREAESALWLHITALCAGGDREGCRAAAYSYLRQFAGGAFAAEARKIINR
jgi:outer membrane protein assembly factor BamD (BamD/ComL family)